ncbi:MAG: hypothetical protein WCG12_03445 [Alcaligenaceae bacterium]
MISLLLAGASPVHANLSLEAIELPQAVVRSVVMNKSEWQGVGVELEQLQSDATLETTLEQLATLLPELTPVWSEQDVVRVHWATAQTSYSLFLWATATQGTEGLLSSLALRPPEAFVQNTSTAYVTALDWLPKQATQLYRFVDTSKGPPSVLASYAVPMVSSLLIQHIKTYAQRNGWLALPEELSFFREAQRLSFQVHSEQGNTTVFFYETSRDAL